MQWEAAPSSEECWQKFHGTSTGDEINEICLAPVQWVEHDQLVAPDQSGEAGNNSNIFVVSEL